MALANGHLMPCGICKNFFLASSYQQPKAKIRRVKWRFRKCDKHNGKILTATNKFSGLIYFPNWTLNCCVKTLFLFSLQRSNYAMVILFWKFFFCLYMRVCLFCSINISNIFIILLSTILKPSNLFLFAMLHNLVMVIIWSKTFWEGRLI